jgi:hypothetical protein
MGAIELYTDCLPAVVERMVILEGAMGRGVGLSRQALTVEGGLSKKRDPRAHFDLRGTT